MWRSTPSPREEAGTETDLRRGDYGCIYFGQINLNNLVLQGGDYQGHIP